MRFIQYLPVLFTAASALPALSTGPAVCGPTSNCEVVETNGTKAYRFKRGFEPGTPAYKKRLAMAPSQGPSLFGREDQPRGINTKVVMGKTQMQWGCDTNVKDKIRDAAKELCSESGGCDNGSDKGWDVDKWEGDDAAPSGAHLNIKLEGKYASKDAHDALLEALLATATDEAAKTEKKKWVDEATASGSHWGLTTRGGECSVTTFPNYVAINRFDGEHMLHTIEFHAELVEGECKPSYLPKPVLFPLLFRALIIPHSKLPGAQDLGGHRGSHQPHCWKVLWCRYSALRIPIALNLDGNILAICKKLANLVGIY